MPVFLQYQQILLGWVLDEKANYFRSSLVLSCDIQSNFHNDCTWTFQIHHFFLQKSFYTTKSHINQIIPYYAFFLTKPNVYNTKTEYMFYLINLYTSVSSCFLENPTEIPEILTTKDIRVWVFTCRILGFLGFLNSANEKWI